MRAQSPMISLSPETMRVSWLLETRPSVEPSRSTESVRIWLIFTHDCWGRPMSFSSKEKG